MVFIALLILITLSIAGSAAFFSIYGLAQIFSGSFWPVVIMATSLEAGKLIAASYVYRYWKHIKVFLRIYLITAVFVLMMITSAGIFGFLSSAYQKDVLPLAEINTKIHLLEQKADELETLKREEIIRRQQLDDQKTKEIAALPSNYATKKKEVSERYAPQILKADENITLYTTQLRAITEEKSNLKLSTLHQELKTGPIVFIASAFGKEVNDATKWLIFIIIFAFDPLAVALTIGANIALFERQKSKEIEFEEPEPIITEIEQLYESDDMSVEQVKTALQALDKRELTPEEVAQKSLLEEILRRKNITQRMRNPNSES